MWQPWQAILKPSNAIQQIIHSVTIYANNQPEAEVAAELGRLFDCAANDNSPGFDAEAVL